jgi:hypothetical protein
MRREASRVSFLMCPFCVRCTVALRDNRRGGRGVEACRCAGWLVMVGCVGLDASASAGEPYWRRQGGDGRRCWVGWPAFPSRALV